MEYKQCPNGHYYQGDKCPVCHFEECKASNQPQSNNVQCPERDEVLLSSRRVSIILLALMCFPLVVSLVIMIPISSYTDIEGVVIGIAVRLAIAALFGLLTIYFSKKADRLVVEQKFDKAVKAAKNARGGNIVQIIYGIRSWIFLIQLLSELNS